MLAVKLQELFGLADTPRIADGRVPLTLHLLSPGGKPLQVTQDLRGFWERTYPEVKKEMKGRYPRHPWPDDPWTRARRRIAPSRAAPRNRGVHDRRLHVAATVALRALVDFRAGAGRRIPCVGRAPGAPATGTSARIQRTVGHERGANTP